MKFNRFKKPKGFSDKGLEGSLCKKKSEKRIGKKLKSFKPFISFCTLIIIPILNILPPEIVILNSVTYQNVQTINVNYELKN